MIVSGSNLLCTAKPKPIEWEFEDRKGVTLKVTLSDGEGYLNLKCRDEEIYNKFEPFNFYDVVIELFPVMSTNSMNGRIVDVKKSR